MKNYWLQFGTGDSRSYTGLSPSFVLFFNSNGATITPPGITEPLVGSGLYTFQYGPTMSMAYQVDGGATLNSAFRFIAGNLDPIQAVDEGVTTINYNVSLMMQSIGSTASSFGSTSVNPGTLYGLGKRIQEFLEGNQTFNKTNGVWDIYSRGSSTLLVEKTLTDTSTQTTRS